MMKPTCPGNQTHVRMSMYYMRVSQFALSGYCFIIFITGILAFSKDYNVDM